MYISDVAKATGLSKKAIRFYESKGLIKGIERLGNGYRDYRAEDVETLIRIKHLRMAGVSVADIHLLFNNVITIDEVLEKRRRELEEQSGNYLENFGLVKSLIEGNTANDEGEFEESAQPAAEGPFAVGLDIGTTSISATVISISQKSQVEVYSLKNTSRIAAGEGFSEFAAEQVVDKAEHLIKHILNTYADVKTIGITGQMHGVLYIDKGGKAVSNLINWQDGRGNMPLPSGKKCIDELFELTGVRAATGYGFATHFYNAAWGLIPAAAHSFCSIMDYVAMRLCGKESPIIHNSVAASFSLFNVAENRFMTEEIAKIKGFSLALPEVTDDFAVLGYIEGVPVSVAIGDNQASFIGAVDNLESGVLVNIGTGSQISAVTSCFAAGEGTEIRPLIKGKYILCGSALCGGKAYAMLESFFRSFCGSEGAVYERMNELAQKALENGVTPLEVDTRFCGTRVNTELRGAITGISEENFTPEALCLGVLKGICAELYSFLPEQISIAGQITASGNGAQKIKTLPRVMEKTFASPVKLPAMAEEAAVGAALFGLTAAGLQDASKWRQFITYKK